MKKTMFLATMVAMLATTSCKKTDEVSTQVVDPKSATLQKATNESMLSVGPSMVISNYTLTVVDTTKILVVHVYSAGSVNLQNVKVQFVSGSTSYTAACYYNGTMPEGVEFLCSPFGKNFLAGSYTVKVFADANIGSTIKDSAEITLSLDCTTKGTGYNLKAKQDNVFFVQGGVFTQVDPNTPKTKNITSGQWVECTRITTSAVGKSYTPTYTEVQVTNAVMVQQVQLRNAYGTIMGTGNPISGLAKINLGGISIGKGATETISVWLQLQSMTNQQTGLATKATITYSEYTDNFGVTVVDNANYSGMNMYVYKNLFSLTESMQTQQIDPSNKMSLFKTSFSGTGAIKQIAYKITWTKAGTDTLRIPLSFEENGADVTGSVWITNQNGDTLTSLVATEATSKIVVMYKSGSGQSAITGSKNYELKGLCKGFATDGSAVKIEIDEDASYVQPTTLSYYAGKQFQATLNGVSANIITSENPNGTAIVGISNPEFRNSYLWTRVKGTVILYK
jgi:hypothetical protein